MQSGQSVRSVSRPVWSVSQPVSLVRLGSLASLDRQDSLVSRVSLDRLVSQIRQSVSQATSQSVNQ